MKESIAKRKLGFNIYVCCLLSMTDQNPSSLKVWSLMALVTNFNNDRVIIAITRKIEQIERELTE